MIYSQLTQRSFTHRNPNFHNGSQHNLLLHPSPLRSLHSPVFRNILSTLIKSNIFITILAIAISNLLFCCLLWTGRWWLCVHCVHQDRVGHKRRHGLDHRSEAVRRVRRVLGDQEPRVLGRTDGARPQLLREGQSGHFQRQRRVPLGSDLCVESHFGRVGCPPRVVR